MDQDIFPKSYMEDYGIQNFEKERKPKNQAANGLSQSSSTQSKSNTATSKFSKTDWVYSEKRVGHMEVNQLLEADEAQIPEVMFSDAIRRLSMDLTKAEARNSKNAQQLREEKQMLKELKNQQKNISDEIGEYVQINDNDRDEIIENTRKLEQGRLAVEAAANQRKNLKPGEKIKIKGPSIMGAAQSHSEFEQEEEICDELVISTRRQSIAIQKTLRGLEDQLDAVRLLDVNDADFLAELGELLENPDPSARRFHDLLVSLTEQVNIESEVIEELDQKLMRERHHQLTEIEERKQELELLREELRSLEQARQKPKPAAIKSVEEEKSVFSGLQLNQEPYNFQVAPQRNSTSKNSYEANLEEFRRSSRASSKQGYLMEPKYTQSNSQRKFGSAVTKGSVTPSFRKKEIGFLIQQS